MPPELVRSYELYADGRLLETVPDNQRRVCRHTMPGGEVSELRIVLKQTWGSGYYNLYALRME